MPSSWRTGQTPRVCIVGAGFAGLRCADILLQAQIDVTILEARDRVGGRVRFVLYGKLALPPDCLRQVHQSEVLGHLADT